jgi:hypothetical protein
MLAAAAAAADASTIGALALLELPLSVVLPSVAAVAVGAAAREEAVE